MSRRTVAGRRLEQDFVALPLDATAGASRTAIERTINPSGAQQGDHHSASRGFGPMTADAKGTLGGPRPNRMKIVNNEGVDVASVLVQWRCGEDNRDRELRAMKERSAT
jgi:hypothetical protein